MTGIEERWLVFVSSVERGYEYGSEEWVNDLSIREKMTARPEPGSVLGEIDERFRRATQTGPPVLAAMFEDPYEWLARTPISPPTVREELDPPISVPISKLTE